MEGFPYGLCPAVVQNRAAVRPITLTLQQHHVMKVFTYMLGVRFGYIRVQQKSPLHPSGPDIVYGRSSLRVRIQCYKVDTPWVAV
jgi:hypothetical protein